ncbi:Aste57867_1698 [Aphanomyces stellatus]|uniref:Aste57867_1698 protein n=1 Tax=Aphanomyces stellatus TaxID=120398 RepID=A0A485K5Q5_9STRA|nr:hypothetical protein As57867_001696 [Aphanomyces stellatus]VFT78909.1 Aste57867_1698 [Aphanomyces stellatus]
MKSTWFAVCALALAATAHDAAAKKHHHEHNNNAANNNVKGVPARGVGGIPVGFAPFQAAENVTETPTTTSPTITTPPTPTGSQGGPTTPPTPPTTTTSPTTPVVTTASPSTTKPPPTPPPATTSPPPTQPPPTQPPATTTPAPVPTTTPKTNPPTTATPITTQTPPPTMPPPTTTSHRTDAPVTTTTVAPPTTTPTMTDAPSTTSAVSPTPTTAFLRPTLAPSSTTQAPPSKSTPPAPLVEQSASTSQTPKSLPDKGPNSANNEQSASTNDSGMSLTQLLGIGGGVVGLMILIAFYVKGHQKLKKKQSDDLAWIDSIHTTRRNNMMAPGDVENAVSTMDLLKTIQSNQPMSATKSVRFLEASHLALPAPPHTDVADIVDNHHSSMAFSASSDILARPSSIVEEDDNMSQFSTDWSVGASDVGLGLHTESERSNATSGAWTIGGDQLDDIDETSDNESTDEYGSNAGYSESDAFNSEVGSLRGSDASSFMSVERPAHDPDFVSSVRSGDSSCFDTMASRRFAEMLRADVHLSEV